MTNDVMPSHNERWGFRKQHNAHNIQNVKNRAVLNKMLNKTDKQYSTITYMDDKQK